MNKHIFGILSSAVILSALPLSAMAVDAGMIKTMNGQVAVERGGQILPATPGFVIQHTDRVRTGAKSNVGITLRDDTLLTAGPNSVVHLDKFAFDTTTHSGVLDVTLKRGTLAVVSGKLAHHDPNAVTFRTPTTTLGVRGTEFIIESSGE
jgi:hypothetical protein